MIVDENALQGGFGSAVLELLFDNRLQDVRVKRLGVPDRFVEQGSQAQLRKDLGIDAGGIAAAVEEFLKSKSTPVKETPKAESAILFGVA